MNKKQLKKFLSKHDICSGANTQIVTVVYKDGTEEEIAINVDSVDLFVKQVESFGGIAKTLEGTRTGREPSVSFRTLSPEEEAEFRKWARENYVPNSPVDPLWHPSIQDECMLMNASSPPPEPEPTIDSLGANTIGKRKSSGPRVGSAMGAKPHVRKLLGTALPDGTYPSMTLDEICAATKKSAINIRTILSDLRSDKYCGSGGVFMTVSSKVGDHTYYTYQP